MDFFVVLQAYLHMLTLAMQHCLMLWQQLLLLMEDEERSLQRDIHSALRAYSQRRRGLYASARLQGQSRRRWWVRPTSQEWWDLFVLRVRDDHQWISNFRMSRETFFEIADALRPHLERETTNMRRPITVEKRLAVALWFLASASTYREVAKQFGLGQSTVALIVVEVCFKIELLLLKRTVLLGDYRKIMDGFADLGMPHTIGVLDGCHLPTVDYTGRRQLYSNHKRFCSILLQGVVDHSGRFINIEVGWSGRNHDAFVFRHSAIVEAMDSGVFVPGNPALTLNGVEVPPLILGDGAYPMRRWLMNAYNDCSTPREAHFNNTFSRCHNVVKCAFGRLKARWGCLAARLGVAEENVVPVVTACVVLHNICESKGHVLDYQELPPCQPAEGSLEASDVDDARCRNEGKQVRDALATWMYNHRA